MQRSDSVRKIKGVGEKAEQCMNQLNIYTVADLLEHYPRTYDEFKPIRSIASLEEGEVVAVEGSLLARPQMKVHGRLRILTITLQDESGSIPVVWFNMPFLRNPVYSTGDGREERRTASAATAEAVFKGRILSSSGEITTGLFSDIRSYEQCCRKGNGDCFERGRGIIRISSVRSAEAEEAVRL